MDKLLRESITQVRYPLARTTPIREPSLDFLSSMTSDRSVSPEKVLEGMVELK